MSWKPVYGLLMFGLTVVNYFFGLAIARALHQRKALLVVSVAANLLTLAVFKYAYFARDVADSVVSKTGHHVPDIPWQIILPLGISFFVFEFIHYVADVYKGGEPVKSFPEFALFASFFPTQIAGPIKRYQDFIPQLKNPHALSLSTIEESARLIIVGLVKKILFADYLAIAVHGSFEHPELLSTVDLWLAVYAFAFQIYFDFSAYTDIARGSALLFGFRVPPNFNLPYFAESISDFWRRWHMSLSTWLRDYLFIPLGGSRKNTIFTYRNLLITMVLGGIWHGAAGHFAVWGAYQGLLLVINKEFQRFSERWDLLGTIRKTRVFHYFSIVLTFHAVCLGWVFFRAESMSAALLIIRKLLFLPSSQDQVKPWILTITNTTESVVFLLLPIMLVGIFIAQTLTWLAAEKKQGIRLPRFVEAAAMAIAVCLLVVFSPDFAPKFIYFQF
jgi:D-alanyl-lipoteichoic acid acyltransferase DltB (MBOAT superfamily)